jgi:hypothetical protein
MTMIVAKEDSLNVESAISFKGLLVTRRVTMISRHQRNLQHQLPPPNGRLLTTTFPLEEAAETSASRIPTVKMAAALIHVENVAKSQGQKCTICATNQQKITLHDFLVVMAAAAETGKSAVETSATRMPIVKTGDLTPVGNAVKIQRRRKRTASVISQIVILVLKVSITVTFEGPRDVKVLLLPFLIIRNSTL